MKLATAFILASSIVLGTLPSLSAADIKDTVRANCTKYLVASTDATRADIKKFPVNKRGSGYEMGGQTEAGSNVSCRTNAEGRVTDIVG